MKKVSVIIPAFNKYHYTKKTIESILNQSYQNIEIILVNDGSNDKTYKLEEEYGSKIKYYEINNSGASKARNLGIEKSEGDYLTFIDCDDVFNKNKIEISVDVLEKNSDYSFVYTDVYFIDSQDKIIEFKDRIKEYPGSGNIAKKILLSNYSITNSTLLVKKECFNKVAAFDEKIFFAADRDLLLRLSLKFKAYYISKKLTGYRIGSGNLFKNIDTNLKEFIYILDKNFKDVSNLNHSFKNHCYSNVYYNIAKQYILNDNLELSKKYFYKSLFLSFIQKKSLKIILAIFMINFMPKKISNYFKKMQYF